MGFQNTIKNAVTRNGVGLHSGRGVEVTILPAPDNTGIVFRRVDLTGIDINIPAHVSNISNVSLCTSICNSDGAEISTIEHLMAAFSGMGVDNAYVEVFGPELPAFDGSATRFCEMITEAKITPQKSRRQYIKVQRPISVDCGESRLSITPADSFQISAEIIFNDPIIGASQYFYVQDDDSFCNELALARTFCFKKDIAPMRANGFAIGGSMENAIIIDDGQILNDQPLRYTDEFVRHKTLDCLGDLRLAGHQIIGHITALRPGHRANSELLKALFRTPDSMMLVT